MLLTRELRTHLRHNADLSAQRERDHKPVVKFFTPDAQATWLFTELAPDQDTLFGLCDLGHGTPELGYASLGAKGVLSDEEVREVYEQALFLLEQNQTEEPEIARTFEAAREVIEAQLRQKPRKDLNSLGNELISRRVSIPSTHA